MAARRIPARISVPRPVEDLEIGQLKVRTGSSRFSILCRRRSRSTIRHRSLTHCFFLAEKS
jgi:hypothetical protein